MAGNSVAVFASILAIMIAVDLLSTASVLGAVLSVKPFTSSVRFNGRAELYLLYRPRALTSSR